jgi:aerobic-type carbon monoxide dehydrogenase small subunit (CoxS/CutS family)/carbon monoxide dehydrogenase subunit G
MDGMTVPAQRSITLTVNNQARKLLVEPRTHLADALREHLNLTGTHLGCEQGVCGACTVLIDDIPQRSCIAYAVDCEGSRITTIEGFDADATMAELREAFSVHHALQCGFCTPGMLITARDIVQRLGEVPEARIREELAGNLCRCTGYIGIVGAVQAVAKGRPAQATPPRCRATEPITKSIETVRSETKSATASEQPVAVPAGGAVLEERVRLAASPDVAWAVLSNPRRLAECLPGAHLDTQDGDRVTGRVTVALGPVRASFVGEGSVSFDAAARSGRLVGRGRDGGSRAEGEIAWSVVSADGGNSEILVRLLWRLTGPLAQFSRGALVRDLVRRLAQDFAHNLDATVAGQPQQPARPIGVFTLLWRWLKSLLGGR